MAVSRRMVALALLGSFRIFGLEPGDQMIAKMQKRYNSARTLSLSFTETYRIQGHSRPPESGTLVLRKQGKMRWNYTHPSGKLFISDGKSVFLYTAGDNRVEKIPLKDTEDMRAPLAFLLGHLDMKKEFRNFQFHPADSGTWLTADAKDARVPYSQIKMLLSEDGSVRQLDITERDESQLDFLFSDEKLNPPAPEKLFEFQIPAGAEVVDSIESAVQEK